MRTKNSLLNIKFILAIFIIIKSSSVFPYNSSGIGSAKVLEGKVFIYYIFLSEPGKSWKFTKKTQALNQANIAEQWLVKEALQYGRRLSIQNGNCDLMIPSIPAGPPLGPITNKTKIDVFKIDIFEVLVKQCGFKSPADFIHWARSKYQVQSVLIGIIGNKAGRSYALPQYIKNDGIEGFFGYGMYNSVQSIDARCIAHETLHVFGAWDLYYSGPQTKQNELLAKSLFPKDIMLTADYPLNKLNLGSLSAWRVGIAPKNKLFNQFDTEK